MKHWEVIRSFSRSPYHLVGPVQLDGPVRTVRPLVEYPLFPEALELTSKFL